MLLKKNNNNNNNNPNAKDVKNSIPVLMILICRNKSIDLQFKSVA